MSRADRIVTLDILRGLAIAGMILVHFHQGFRGTPPDVTLWPGEELSAWVIWIGIENKSAAMFAFLFGVGFAVLLRRADANGRPVVAFYLRRLWGLALFGIAVEALTGYRILIHLAISGVVLLFVRRLSVRALVWLAVAAALATPLYVLGLGVHELLTGGAEAAAAATPPPPPTTYGEEVLRRLQRMPALYLTWGRLVPGTTIALFLLGFAALRHGVFDEPKRHTRVILTAMAVGAISGLLYWLALPRMPEGWWRWNPNGWAIRYGLGVVGDDWIAFAYIGAVVLLLAHREAWARRLDPFAIIGRMALTNYVLQAAIIYWMKSPFGLGLHLRPYYRVLGAGLLCAALALFSYAWLARVRYGPLEWVWRRLSYGRVETAPGGAVPSGSLTG